MKKSLLALAVLGAFAGTAAAQSSVTLYGTVDLNGRFVKNDNQSRRFSMAQDGVNSSQLGFRGVEDLGGGLRAGFNLLAGVNADSGTSNAKFWNRRATVSLFSPVGELRLGRDYTPTFWNSTIFDAFGTNGLGNSQLVARYTHVRQDNAIGYFLPSNLGGLYGQLMVAASENNSTGATAGSAAGDKPARYLGGRVGFAAGPFDIAVAAAQDRFTNISTLAVAGTSAITLSNAGASAGAIVPGDKVTTYNVGGSFDFGFMKLMSYVERVNFERSDETRGHISANFRMGQGEFRIGYNRSKYDSDAASAGVDATIQHAAATYQYNLSKRTAMYGTVAWLDNKDTTSFALGGGNGTPGAGGTSKGFELGVRHFF
jgi:predicted porin